MISLFDSMREEDFEQVLFCNDPIVGLHAIIVIHDTTLGPAMGGIRMCTYASEEEAFQDALSLAKALTWKAANAGLNLGGGSAVIMGDPKVNKTEGLWRSFGRHVEILGGRFIAAEDVGTNVDDIETIGLETRFVAGVAKSRGGSGMPALKAALGVYRGIQACCKAAFGDENLRDRVIAVQGIGSVGYELARLLSEDGAKIKASDKLPKRIEVLKKRFPIDEIAPDAILTTECEVLAPCAMGGVIREEMVPELKARIIAGSANNQLADYRIADLLRKKGIIYAPDFVINAGGLINAAEELHGYDESRAIAKVNRIFHEIEEIINISRSREISTYQAALEKANARIKLIREIRKTGSPQ